MCLLFVRISVHLTDNTRLDLIIPGEQLSCINMPGYCNTLDTQVCLLFVHTSVHPTDNTRLDLIIPGEQHYYVKAAQPQERQSWLIALGSAKAKYSQTSQEPPGELCLSAHWNPPLSVCTVELPPCLSAQWNSPQSVHWNSPLSAHWTPTPFSVHSGPPLPPSALSGPCPPPLCLSAHWNPPCLWTVEFPPICLHTGTLSSLCTAELPPVWTISTKWTKQENTPLPPREREREREYFQQNDEIYTYMYTNFRWAASRHHANQEVWAAPVLWSTDAAGALRQAKHHTEGRWRTDGCARRGGNVLPFHFAVLFCPSLCHQTLLLPVLTSCCLFGICWIHCSIQVYGINTGWGRGVAQWFSSPC